MKRSTSRKTFSFLVPSHYSFPDVFLHLHLCKDTATHTKAEIGEWTHLKLWQGVQGPVWEEKTYGDRGKVGWEKRCKLVASATCTTHSLFHSIRNGLCPSERQDFFPIISLFIFILFILRPLRATTSTTPPQRGVVPFSLGITSPCHLQSLPIYFFSVGAHLTFLFFLLTVKAPLHKSIRHSE